MTTTHAVSPIMEETLNSVRNKHIHSTYWERIIISLEAKEKFEGMEEFQRRAAIMEYIVDNASTIVKPYDKILGRVRDTVIPCRGSDTNTEGYDGEALLKEWRVAKDDVCFDFGHECFDWELLLELGLPGMQDRAVAARREDHTENQQLFLLGAEKVYAAIRRHITRYAGEAEKLGLAEPARVARVCADGVPTTFYEALQLVFFVGHIYSSLYAINSTLTYGRVDQYLYPFYSADLEAGVTTREEVASLLEDFYCKNNLVLGRGEHQLDDASGYATSWLRNPMYDTPQYIILGGYRAEGEVINGLTRQMIEAIVPRFKNPTIVLRYNTEWDEDTLRLAAKKILDNSTILVYNDDRCIPAWKDVGFKPEEALEYVFNGCNWPTLPAKQTFFGVFELINMPQALDNALTRGEFPKDIEEVYSRFASNVEERLRGFMETYKVDFKEQVDNPALHFNVDNLFMQGCIEKATPGLAGGLPYHNMKFSFIGMATTTDAITALEEGVYSESPLCSVEDMKKNLRRNWKDNEALRSQFARLDKYGQDNEKADKHAERIMKIVTELSDKMAGEYAADFSPELDKLPIYRSLQSDTECVWRGGLVGALPHGRLAGTPISENTSPEPGAAKNGLTAQLNSVRKLQAPINSGALNIQLAKSMFSGSKGVELLMSVLKGYFGQGGLQLQCSYLDISELRDAQKNPEKYRDLMIRVTGYSTAFVELSEDTQEYIIRRYI